MTLAEIAEELRMSPATIRSWISRGRLQAAGDAGRAAEVAGPSLGTGSDAARRGLRRRRRPAARPLVDGERPRQRRPPDSITARGPDVDPEDWLGVAQWEWLAALEESRMAPPDAWFVGRLRRIAEAAARKAEALGVFPEHEEVRWKREPGESSFTLSYELRPGGNRPGPSELWAEFDAAVKRLGSAIKSGRAGLRGSLEELSVVLHELADSLGRYRDHSANWQEQPQDKTAE